MILRHIVVGTSAATLATTPAQASLVASYLFDNPTNLGLDSSGNNNHLTNFGTVAAGAGISGGGLLLAGTGMLSTPNQQAPAGTPIGNSAYTISAWLKTDQVLRNGIVGWGSYGQIGKVNALRTAPDFGGLLNYGWSRDTPAYFPQIFDNTWHHVVATYDGTMRSIYVDKNLINQALVSPALSVTTAFFAVGRTCDACGDEFFRGSLDSVKIYSSAFSAQDVAAEFSSASAVPEPGMIGLLGFGLLGLVAARRRAR